MSHLPGTISIKRKLEEEPPDTLYIEREGQGSDAGEYHARPVYRRVQAGKRSRIREGSISIAQSETVPWDKVLACLATPDQITPGTPLATGKQSQTEDNIPNGTSSSKSKPVIVVQQKRVFHLSTTKTSGLSRASSSSSLRGSIRRSQRGKHGSSIAVFAEKRALRVDQMARSLATSRPGTPASPGVTNDDSSAVTNPQKRPLTRLSETQRNSILSRVAISKDAKVQDDEASLKLAAELSRFALKLDNAAPVLKKDTAQVQSNILPTIEKKPMKFQPRPPPARTVQSSEADMVMHDSESPAAREVDTAEQGDTDDWVYDVYVRDIAPPSQVNTKIEESMMVSQPDQVVQDESVGFLVIRAEDEERWEEFMSDEEDSEYEVGGEDEDSNAEDYYGNDYPDEPDSDDEWAITHDSENEYGDEDEYAHSDKEDD